MSKDRVVLDVTEGRPLADDITSGCGLIADNSILSAVESQIGTLR